MIRRPIQVGKHQAWRHEGYPAGEDAAEQDLAMVLGRVARKLLADEILRAEPGRAGHSALYTFQGGGRQEQRFYETRNHTPRLLWIQVLLLGFPIFVSCF
jgi:hypothetical protein